LSSTTAVTKLQDTEPEKTALAFWNGEQWTPLGIKIKLKKKRRKTNDRLDLFNPNPISLN